MWAKLKDWIHKLTTEPDNTTPCIFRIGFACVLLYVIGAHGYTIFVQHVALNIKEFFEGLSFGVASFGAADMMKKVSPKQESESNTP